MVIAILQTVLRTAKFHRQFSSRSGAAREITDPLVDSFGRFHNYLRISLTERCNLRCVYCMPAEGVELQPKDNILSRDEIVYLAKLFASQGVSKIRLTGGEPTVRKDLVDIVHDLASIPGIDSVAMTSNGIALERHLDELKSAGLTNLNVSLDTLNSERFTAITRRKGMEKVLGSVEKALQLSFNSVKLNCVVMRGQNDDEMVSFVNFVKNRNMEVRFIEYMPFDGNKWSDTKIVPYAEMLAKLRSEGLSLERLSDGPNETSKTYHIPGYIGRVGFITSMTEHFCDSCNRLRITADGNLKVCLFGKSEVNLRKLVRDPTMQEQDIMSIISQAVKGKKKNHGGWKQMIRSRNPGQLFGFNHAITIPNSVTTSPQWRLFSSQQSNLTHVNEAGKIHMVSVETKPNTHRRAIAEGKVLVSLEAFNLVEQNSMKKGDVISVAKIAGIMGAKQTSNLIPLCHPLSLSSIKCDISCNRKELALDVRCEVVTTGPTGVEMEALTGVSVACLTIYDMVKAVCKDAQITNIQLLSKTGGKSGEYNRQQSNSIGSEGEKRKPT